MDFHLFFSGAMFSEIKLAFSFTDFGGKFSVLLEIITSRKSRTMICMPQKRNVNSGKSLP